MPEPRATRAADHECQGKDCQPSPRVARHDGQRAGEHRLGGTERNLRRSWGARYGKNRLKRRRAVRQSSTTRLAAGRDANLGTAFRRLPGSGRQLGTQENAEKLAERAGARARDARWFSDG